MDRVIHNPGNVRLTLPRRRRGFFLNIRQRLIISYFLLVMFIILVGVLSYKSASKAIISNYESTMQQTLDMQGDYLEYGFDTVKSVAVDYLVDDELIAYLSGELDDNKAEQQKYYTNKKSEIVTKADSNEFIKSIYFFTDKEYSLSTNKKSTLNMYTEYTKTPQGEGMGQEVQKYYWFGEKTVIDDTLNVNSDDYAIRLVKAYYNLDAFLAIDVDVQTVLEVLNKISPGEGSKIAFITADGKELASDGSRNELFTATEFYKNAATSEEQIGYVDNVSYENENYMYLYRKISDTGAMLCVLVPKSTVLDQVVAIKYVALILTLIATVLAVLIGMGITVSISKSIQKMIHKIEEIARGDVSVRLDDKKKDEFGRLAVHMNLMLENITALLKHAKNVSKKINASALEVKESSAVFAESSYTISCAMDEIREGLSKQADDTANCVGIMEKLAEKIELVDKETKEIGKIADSTGNAIEDSCQSFDMLNSNAKETYDATQAVIRSIEDLNQKSKRISDIISVIKEIADETELLSLNASIEAARAGDSGRGFHVVAEEIKKLASQSLASSEEIKKIVNDIVETAAQAAVTVNAASNSIDAQEKTVFNSKESFLTMKEQSENLLQNVGSIGKKVTQMQEEKENSVINMENISAVTEEVVASVYTINEKAQGQVYKAQNLTELSELMTEQAKQLEMAMAKFII